MAAFDPQKALTNYGRRFNSSSKSVFDHPKIRAWLKVWVPEQRAGFLSWPDLLELVHRGCESENVPFPERGSITTKALSEFARKLR